MSGTDRSGIVARMRISGVIETARNLGAHDHTCWVYDDPDDLRGEVREFLAEGLALDQRVCYVAPGDPQMLAENLCGLDGLTGALQRGAAQLVPLDSTYPVGTVIEPDAQVHTYAAATQQALAAGFTGLRVAAEVTSLVRTPSQLDAFARYEHLVDRYMTSWPFSAMCAYDRGQLGEAATAQLACLHPNTNTAVPGFRLHASRGVTASLAGELDWGNATLLGQALERADLQPGGGELVIDAAEVSFMDHRSLIMLAEHARRNRATVVLRIRWPGAARLVQLLNLDGVRVEPLA
jgi:anti-anti-sigma regulatory factor